jgi:hypothetical protein
VDGYNSTRAVGLLDTATSYGPTGTEQTAIWFSNNLNLAHAGYSNGPVNGQDTWYRMRIRFPAGGLYQPTTGQLNWLTCWHDDSHTVSYNSSAFSICLGVYTDYPVVTNGVGKNPHLVLRLMGGNTMAPSTYTCQLPSNSLLYGHWYDQLFHINWNTSSTAGLAEWWVDGANACSVHFPTLYTNPDGSHSYNSFGLYHYRLKVSWNSRVDYDNVVIGPSRSSVGG